MRKVITRSGKLIDPINPHPGDLCIVDIAWALAHECRWNGALGFRSVGWHSIAVCLLLKDRGASLHHQLGGLLHDAAEAFLGDVPSPLKATTLPDFRAVEHIVFANVCQAFGLSLIQLMGPEIGRADEDVAMYEYRHFATSAMVAAWMPDDLGAWPERLTLAEPSSCQFVYESFLALYRELCAGIENNNQSLAKEE